MDLHVCLLLVVLTSLTTDVCECNVIKLCRIPRVDNATIENPSVTGIREASSGLVISDVSTVFKYECMDKWREARCIEGSWSPAISKECTHDTCRITGFIKQKAGLYDNTFNETDNEVPVNTVITIKCLKRSSAVPYNISCHYGGYWIPKPCNRVECGTRKMRKVYGRQLELLYLNGSDKAVVLCPKGLMWMDDNKDTADSGLVHWYLDGGHVLSGLQVSCDFREGDDTLSCRDVNECKELRIEDRRKREYIKANCTQPPDEEGPSGSGNGNGDQEPDNCMDDYEELSPTLLERDIITCQEHSSCVNRAPSYLCKCDASYVKRNGTCVKLECPDVTQPRHGTVKYSVARLVSYVFCDEHFVMDGTTGDNVYGLCAPDSTWVSFHGGQPITNTPKCIRDPNYCGQPNAPRNGWMTTTGDTLHGTALYFCNNGYKLNGDRTRTCQHGGYWSGYIPTCIKRIPLLTSMSNIRKDYIDQPGPLNNSGFTNLDAERAYVPKAGVDLIFAIDTSASVRSQANLDRVLCLCALVVDQLFLSGHANSTRIGVVTFGSKIETPLTYEDKNQHNNQSIRNIIKGIRVSGGGTPFVDAMQKALDIEHKATNRYTNSKLKVLILITDGYFSTTQNRIEKILYLKSKLKYVVYTVGFGNYNRHKMREITPDPSHRLGITNAQSVADLADDLFETTRKDKLCGYSEEIVNVPTDDDSYILGHRRRTRELSWGWMVAIRNDTEFIGAGSLICERWVLTSKTALDHITNPAQIKVSAGVDHVFPECEANSSNVQISGVARIHMHPDNSTDLALLEMHASFILNQYVRTVCVPTTKDMTTGRVFETVRNMNLVEKVGVLAVAGWDSRPLLTSLRHRTSKYVTVLHDCSDNSDHGLQESNEDPMYTMREGQIVEDNTQVNVTTSEAPTVISRDTYCSREENEMCARDTGGPVIYSTDLYGDTRYVIVAMATPKTDCGDGVKNGRFENVLTKLEWIHKLTENCAEQHIKDNHPKTTC